MGLHILVLAGGNGTRLWPVSRASIPKHLLPLGPGGTTLLRATVERVLDLGTSVHVVTAGAQAALCRAALDGLGLGDDAIICEPEARGTGPALGLATRLIAAADPDAVIASVHADHHVGDVAAYRRAVVAAAGWAEVTGGLASVGIIPAHAATGFGYIETAAGRDPAEWRAPTGAREPDVTAAADLPAFVAAGFREKPNADTAAAFVAGGRHLWNLGLFAWPARVFLDELAAADPALDAALGDMAAAVTAGNDAEAAAIYAALRPTAVEPLIFERTPQLTVVRATFPWSDLGSWSDLLESRRADGEGDAQGNVVDGDAVVIDSHGCLVSARGSRIVAVAGATGLVVVDTGDAVLVVPADRAQEVKGIVDALRAEGRGTVV